MMDDYLIDRKEVERRVGLNGSTIYAHMRQGAFPLPLKIGLKAVRWRASEISNWMDSLPRASGDLEWHTEDVEEQS